VAAGRVLLDTNILVSAALFGGKPGRCLALAEEGRITLVSSIHVLRELADVLARPRLRVDAEDAASFIEAVTSLADIVPVESTPAGECRDAHDEPVLLAAVVGAADVIVTGDRDLLELRRPPVPVATVDAFLAGFA